MKMKATVLLAGALVVGAGAFTWRAVPTPSHHESAVHAPELGWLQQEFALSDDAVRRIAALHRHYTAECEPMCEALRSSDAEVSRLISSEVRVTAEITAALNQSNAIAAECQRRMLAHFYEVAREMPPAAGERYLDLMTPLAAHPEKDWLKMRP